MSTKLKILVVDDEELIREGICRKINRLFPQARIVGQAQDANEALELLKSCRPNVIITDIRMPEIDGLQFINLVKQLYREVRFIVISGYQDFEYARRSIRLGVEDYLLKPIENEQLAGILQKLERQLEEESGMDAAISALKAQASHGLESLKSKFMTDMIHHGDEFDIRYILKNLELIGIHFTLPLYTVVCISLSSYENLPCFPEKEDRSLVRFAIRNIAEEILSGAGNAITFENVRNDRQLIAVINHEKELPGKSDSNLHRLCSRIIHSIGRFLKLPVTLGIGRTYECISKLHTSYMEAYTAVMQKILLGESRVIRITDIPETNRITFFIQEDTKLLLLCHIKAGNRKKANEIMDGVFSQVYERQLPYANIRLLYTDLLLLLSRTVKEAGGSWERIFPVDVFSEESLSDYTSLEMLRQWFQNCITTICSYLSDLSRSEGKKVVEEIRSYIENFYYSDISLNTLADKYYLNSSYLSQLFKAETGQNFVDYLTQVRLEKAKTLLSQTELKAYQISEMVGYSNSRYFSEVFQRYTGSTPTEFREQCRCN